jgi:hypothetical protein
LCLFNISDVGIWTSSVLRVRVRLPDFDAESETEIAGRRIVFVHGR